MTAKAFRSGSALLGVLASLAGMPNVHAGAPACAVAGRIPAAVQVKEADESTPPAGLVTLGWNGSQQLQVRQQLVLTGDCQSAVTGFSARNIHFSGNLLAPIGDDGALQAARSAPRLPSLPQMNEDEHAHDEEGHTHSDSGLGEFLTGAQVAVKNSPSGATAYFVGAWKKGTAYTIAMFARNPQGILSPAAPLMRSQLPVRGISYVSGAAATSGVLGITQEAPGELRLISVDWTHPDFSR